MLLNCIRFLGEVKKKVGRIVSVRELSSCSKCKISEKYNTVKLK